MTCAICEKRRPRRFCPGVRGEICPICCGTEREVSVNCPLECEYLAEARRRERPVPIDPATVPNRDIEFSEELVLRNQPLLNALGAALFGAALESGAVDADAREALDALARTYRTLTGGVYYETRPAGAYAGAIYAAIQDAAERFRAAEQQQFGLTRTRDADVLALLVFLQRIELDRNNGRPRGRAFIGSLQFLHAASAPPSPRSSLILP
ncbi:MAG: hypothetical protein KGN36_03555 [Acidobacteriota bacterium]|nr:hypothetical protein [Acidobacteriota bacterium]